MRESVIDRENTSKSTPDTAKPKGSRKPEKKAKAAKRADRAKKLVRKPKTDGTNKKASP